MLQRALFEHPVQVLTVLTLVRSQPLQPLSELHGPEASAPRERTLSDRPERGMERDALEAGYLKRVSPYRFEAFWEFHAPQVLAVGEDAFLNGLQRGRQPNRFQTTPVKTVFPNVLQALRERDSPQSVAARECAAPYPLQRLREHDALQRAVAENSTRIVTRLLFIRPQYRKSVV